jgi:hypothetical protein
LRLQTGGRSALAGHRVITVLPDPPVGRLLDAIVDRRSLCA